MSVRIGIAGIGFMGMIHYLAYQKVREARVVALCSQNARRRAGDWRGIRGNFGPAGTQMDLSGMRTFSRLDDMLADDEIDLVDLTLPPALHADSATRALARGKHVFCEKPLALSVGECRRVVQEAKKARRQLYVGHVLPFFPEYAWALEAVRNGKHGKLLGGSFRREILEPTWVKNFWQSDEVGGPMFDLHVHDAHFIRLLFGMPQQVVASGTLHRGLPRHWHTLMSFKDQGYSVHATCGVIDPPGPSFCHGFEINLEGAKLNFEFAVTDGEGRYTCPPTIIDQSGKVKAVRLRGGDPMDAFRAELQEVARAAKANRPSELLAGELALDAIAICHAEATSLSSGKPARC